MIGLSSADGESQQIKGLSLQTIERLRAMLTTSDDNHKKMREVELLMKQILRQNPGFNQNEDNGMKPENPRLFGSATGAQQEFYLKLIQKALALMVRHHVDSMEQAAKAINRDAINVLEKNASDFESPRKTEGQSGTNEVPRPYHDGSTYMHGLSNLNKLSVSNSMMSLASMQSFGRHMIKIYKYLSVIDKNKQMFIKFSDVLKPLYEQIKC